MHLRNHLQDNIHSKHDIHDIHDIHLRYFDDIARQLSNNHIALCKYET